MDPIYMTVIDEITQRKPIRFEDIDSKADFKPEQQLIFTQEYDNQIKDGETTNKTEEIYI